MEVGKPDVEHLEHSGECLTAFEHDKDRDLGNGTTGEACMETTTCDASPVSSSLGNGTTCATLPVSRGHPVAMTVEERIAIIEKALIVQTTAGASHLQKIEKDPAAYGLDKSVRPQVRKLRLRRNQALHGFDARNVDLDASHMEVPDTSEEELAAAIALHSSLGKGRGAAINPSAAPLHRVDQ